MGLGPMLRSAVALILAAIILTGCIEGGIFGEKKTEPLPEEAPSYQNETYSDYHVYENVMAMGHATSHEYNISVNQTMELYWNATYRFEEPLIGESGYVNITLEKDGMALVSEQYTATTTTTTPLYYNASNITGENFTLVIQSVGRDHTIAGGLQDYYEIDTIIYYR